MAPVSSKEFLDIQATIECRFTLKLVSDSIVTYIRLGVFTNWADFIPFSASDESVSEKFNNYFRQIVDSLNLYEFPSKPSREYADEIDNIVSKFKTHPSIVKIKKHFKISTTFSFSPTSKDEIVAIIKDLQNNKAVGGEIPLNILKK